MSRMFALLIARSPSMSLPPPPSPGPSTAEVSRGGWPSEVLVEVSSVVTAASSRSASARGADADMKISAAAHDSAAISSAEHSHETL